MTEINSLVPYGDFGTPRLFGFVQPVAGDSFESAQAAPFTIPNLLFLAGKPQVRLEIVFGIPVDMVHGEPNWWNNVQHIPG